MLLKLSIVIMMGCFSLLTNAKQSNHAFHPLQSLLQTATANTAAKLDDRHKLVHYSHQNYRQFRGSHRKFYSGSRRIYRNDLRIYNNGQRLDNIGTRFRGNIYINPRKIYQHKYRFNNYPNYPYDDEIIINRPYNRFQQFQDENNPY
ncbi:hypothetical protein [Legionella sp. W05-934-2]|uniref:hypothetical protein n=1 Tax=Legionella sp. W05-934-2 TaxID=1198649 RepID=UPI003462C800